MVTNGGVVYVVAKAPRPGVCKTRLCPPLTPTQAADLARAFLVDTLAIVHEANLTARVICSGVDDRELLEAMLSPSVSVGTQSGRGLGDALEAAFRQGLADGFERVAVLGADSPTLPSNVLRDAMCALDTRDTVALGPSLDGGYYLLAASVVYPWLFRSMVWSTSQVAAETLRRCAGGGLRTHLLPAWYDVDDLESLAALDAELLVRPASVAAETRTVRQAMARSTPDRFDAVVGAGA